MTYARRGRWCSVQPMNTLTTHNGPRVSAARALRFALSTGSATFVDPIGRTVTVRTSGAVADITAGTAVVVTTAAALRPLLAATGLRPTDAVRPL